MTIFVSIASLKDPETMNTIETAINNADSEIRIGLSLTTTLEYFIDLRETLKSYSNVSLYWIDPKTNWGVGTGRNAARDLYNGEDYFLQVDAHTNFEKSWDTQLINIFNEALEQTKSDKTVLTAMPNRYIVSNGSRNINSRLTQYPIFVPNYLLHDDFPMLRWDAKTIAEFPARFSTDERIVPANKFTASFAFGNKEFANFYGLPKECIFFDEEIIQSINLLGDGFSLAFPNMEIPLTHLFFSDIIEEENERHNLFSVFPHGEPVIYLWNHYNKFIDDPNNLEKCKYFEKYSGYRLRSKIPAQYFIPKNYRLTT